MAKIRPFKAWRYDETKVGELYEQFSPLFDVVNNEQLQQLYERPYNSIHLSVPLSHDETVGRLQDWKDSEILVQDEKPAIYVYYQYFTLFGERKTFVRKGFISMIKVEEDQIILHEDTIAHSVAKRVELLNRTQLNVAPTHGLYRDQDSDLEELMDHYMEHPVYQHIDYQGVINKLAVVTDPDHVQRFVNKLADQPVYLADGHHRLESSRSYRNQLAQQQALEPEDMANYHMMYLTNLDADDLRILPTHRVYQVSPKPDLSQIRENLSAFFELEDVSRSRRSLIDLLKDRERAFGMASMGRKWILQLKPDVVPEDIVDLQVPDPIKRLSYTLLHYLVFDQVLGINYKLQRNSGAISYEKDYSRAIAAVNSGKATLAFIAQGVEMATMLEICATGHKMPQKSTYFYPKVVCGLVFGSINKHET
jgi:uncharacterized protein (DUF1015 family)